MSYDFVTAWAEFPPVEEMAAEAAALEEVTCQQTGFGTLGCHMVLLFLLDRFRQWTLLGLSERAKVYVVTHGHLCLFSCHQSHGCTWPPFAVAQASWEELSSDEGSGEEDIL